MNLTKIKFPGFSLAWTIPVLPPDLGMAVDIERQSLRLIGRQESGDVKGRNCRLVTAGGFGELTQVELVAFWRIHVPVGKLPGQPVFAAGGVLPASGEVSEGVVNADAPVNERAVIVKAFLGHVFMLG
jgi:hypothetical protein